MPPEACEVAKEPVVPVLTAWSVAFPPWPLNESFPKTCPPKPPDDVEWASAYPFALAVATDEPLPPVPP
jgi:hypothetical protein